MPTDILLSHLESIEYKSLVWGFVDGSISEDELYTLAEQTIQATGSDDDAEDLIEKLIEARLIHEFRDPNGQLVYRSRFAEGVRLLSRLRQWFPKTPWFSAPRLISDFRIDVRPRRYPRRDISTETALQSILEQIKLNALQQTLWGSLTPPSLAQFQVEASSGILNKNRTDKGFIITAGTGSGKTLCFYLPALLQLGDLIQRNQYWVKALAIYPRTELLKDQFAETFRMARRLDAALNKAGKRPLLIGTLFGMTPNHADEQSLNNWQRQAQGYICPFIGCPDCGGDMLWRHEDIQQKRERLTCSCCNSEISEQQIIITRKRLKKTPPDILFSTSEMLNRRLADSSTRHLFGIGQVQKPRLMLLDEVHTYAGTSGAHAALVLRRWRHALNAPVTYVGLSATLLEAELFFSELTGLRPEKVIKVAPTDAAMMEESAEYQLILCGDPVSQTSLLSASIQTAMLMGRLLDPPNSNPSAGRYGKRLFAFTDDLDVTNRLFDSLRDAEAYDLFGRVDPNRQPLALLRGCEPASDVQLRDMDGQRWKLCEDIGRPLNERLRVSRTTSKDAGVTGGSDVIVATAALEVGFNDPEVGAVIQHKAPFNMAAYIQRKGRAGRTRQMRPWTVTILSDYGRDRLAYQAYEQLFDPILQRQTLPIGNQYLLRMQGVFAFMDWLSAKLNSGGWLWRILSQPIEDDWAQKTRRKILNILTPLLRGDETLLEDLRTYLKGALSLDDNTVISLFWEAPRALLLEVLPTLIRRLHANWQLAYPHGEYRYDHYQAWLPLPEFIPANLFSDLNLPDVQLIIPPATVNHEEKQESLPVLQAMNFLPPGRVTRRFAEERGELNHWIGVSPLQSEFFLPLDTYAETHEYIGDFTAPIDDKLTTLPVYRPWQMRLQTVRKTEVLPTSNARLIWHSQFIPQGEAIQIPPPIRTPWHEIIHSLNVYLHAFRAAVQVRRFASGSDANIRLPKGEESQVRTHFVDDKGEAVGVGFEQEVDGLLLEYHLPSISELMGQEFSLDLLAANRVAYFRYRVLSDTQLPDELNSFQRDWLQQIYLSALLSYTAKNVSVEAPQTTGDELLSQAAQELHADDPQAVFQEVMRCIFSLQEAQQHLAEENNETDEKPTTRLGRLQQSLSAWLTEQEVLERLRELAQNLWQADEQEWAGWLRQRIHETLGQALFNACQQCAPRYAALNTLVMDLGELEDEQPAKIWITETTLGGAGVMQALAQRFTEEPRQLFRAMESVLAPADLELTHIALARFVDIASEDQQTAEVLTQMRASNGHQAREVQRKQLYAHLSATGLHLSHAASVALNARLLRPGMTSCHDHLLRDLLHFRSHLENHLGIAIDLRVFCYLAAVHPDFAQRIGDLLLQHQVMEVTERVQVLSGILWPHSHELRQRSLESYNPFRQSHTTDPLLVKELLLQHRVPSVALADADWSAQVHAHLADIGVCRLWTTQSQDLHPALARLLVEPVNVAYLQLYPSVERFEQDAQSAAVVLSLRESL
ncbi:protein DpdJ [Candidatus Venteria ishoeyi]|uniref:Putative ATP-dependent helicase Lhr n=1 Tax=Candidatus Venteria ishoeyi TaxID=1899563 RepID=A0A1H6F8H3_9GAMM|nr:protein DpdJ [Candidatus Venteria ishoeyi]SEH06422.1 putative ATP-dependent helicase Lhr [Candidatus Venteria ishoeyi]